MEFYQLEQFKAAAELSHITRAARQLSVSQPALSKSIKALENEFGYPLFDHVGKNVQLNANGKIVLRYINEILCAADNIKKELDDANHAGDSHISLCIHAASGLIPEVLLQYNRLYPSVQFSLSQPYGETEDPALLYDFVIDASLEPGEGDDSCTLLKEELLAALPATHPLSKKESIRLSELKQENFISLKKGLPLASITEYYCRLDGFSPKVVFESDNPSTLRNLIRLGLGVAVIPALTWKELEGEGLRLLPIRPLSCFRYINLQWSSRRYLSASAYSFKDFLIRYFEERYSVRAKENS